MTQRDLVVTGQAFVGNNQTFNFGDEFVEASPVPDDDLHPCEPGQFIAPTAEWRDAPDKLRQHRLVILRGQAGSGRRTAALRLLLDHCEPETLHDLTPAWERPRVSLLTSMQPGHGYVLDMTEPAEQAPENDFGARLLGFARQQAIYLVVLTTDEAWSGKWAAGAQAAEIRFASPNARELVTSQLQTAHAGHHIPLLSATEFTEIWKSRPKTENACRLTRLIKSSENRNPAQIADEYGNWRDWINKQLPSELGPRVLMWSCAFCDSGKQRSVLKMAEDLRRHLGETRGDREILLDPPASKRLEAAHVETDGDRVRLSPDRHGLAQAVRRHLWEEYDAQRPTLTRWLKDQVVTLPFHDARRVVDSMFDLVIHCRDDALLTALRNTLVGDLRPLAVQVFSKAALDSHFGAHMRSRLYSWLRHSPSQELIDVVAEVCGGQFGMQQPDMALSRLRLAVQKSSGSSQALSAAFDKLATHYPLKVLAAIDGWFSSPSAERAGINAFLGLASFESGARLLCQNAALRDGPGTGATIIGHFHRALDDRDSRETALRVVKIWGNSGQQGELDRELTIAVLGRVLAPYIRDNVMAGFPDAINVATYWGEVFQAAVLEDRKAAVIASAGPARYSG